MPVLTGSVGRDGHNAPQDVRLVEFLLNRAHSITHAPEMSRGDFSLHLFAPDSKVDDKTIGQIELFQRRVAGMQYPDGRVDPGQRTINALIRVFRSQGGVVQLDRNQLLRRIGSRPQSAQLPDAPLMLPRELKPMQVIPGMDGTRLILSATRREVLFVLMDLSGPGDEFRDWNPMRGQIGKYYAQNTFEFLDENATRFGLNVAEQLQPTKRLVAGSVDVMLGIVAGSSIYGLATVVAVKGMAFLYDNSQYFPYWWEIIKALYHARNDYKHYAPTLYDKLTSMGMIANVYGDKVAPELKGNLKVDAFAYWTGVLLGTAGKTALTKKFNVVLFLLSCSYHVLRILAKTTPDAVIAASKQWDGDANQLMARLREADVDVSPQELKAIFNELKQHHRELRATTERLHQTIQANRIGF